jgi:hypothetical protein
MVIKTSTAQHVFRQRSSVALATVCGVTGLLLLLALARNWADYPRPSFVAWVIFGLAVAWSVFVRPMVLVDAEGVTLRNVVRDVYIPWTRLSDATSRWNLKVFVGDKGFTAWAISSEPDRHKAISGGMFRMPIPGRLRAVASADAKLSTTEPKATAQTVARFIKVAKQEYDEAVENGELPAAPDAMVRVTWVPLVVAVLLVPLIVVVALSVG